MSNRFLEKIASKYDKGLSEGMKSFVRLSQKADKVFSGDALKTNMFYGKASHKLKLDKLKNQRDPKLPK